MSDDHTARAASLEARLSSVQMEIDDDDEDVILVSVDMTNEAVIPLGGLEVHVLTSDGKKVESDSGISSLGPGLTRNFSFEFPLEKGTWTFSVSGAGQSLSLGPYDADFTFEAEQGRAFGNAIGSTLEPCAANCWPRLASLNRLCATAAQLCCESKSDNKCVVVAWSPQPCVPHAQARLTNNGCLRIPHNLSSMYATPT